MIRVDADDAPMAATDRQPAQRMVLIIEGGRPARPPYSTAVVNERLTARLIAASACYDGIYRHTWALVAYTHIVHTPCILHPVVRQCFEVPTFITKVRALDNGKGADLYRT